MALALLDASREVLRFLKPCSVVPPQRDVYLRNEESGWRCVSNCTSKWVRISTLDTKEFRDLRKSEQEGSLDVEVELTAVTLAFASLMHNFVVSSQ
jgi:hypothetical protein